MMDLQPENLLWLACFGIISMFATNLGFEIASKSDYYAHVFPRVLVATVFFGIWRIVVLEYHFMIAERRIARIEAELDNTQMTIKEMTSIMAEEFEY